MTLMSVDGIHTLQSAVMQLESTQEETDTRVVLYSLYAQASGYHYVQVKSPDSDIFFILLANNELMDIPVFYDTKVAGKKRIINIESLGRNYGPKLCVAMLGLHAFTHCDSTSAFKGRGKRRAFKLLEKKLDYHDIFAAIGNDWVVSNDVIDGLEKFTCELYGKSNFNSINAARYYILKSKCGDGDDLRKRHKLFPTL